MQELEKKYIANVEVLSQEIRKQGKTKDGRDWTLYSYEILLEGEKRYASSFKNIENGFKIIG